MKTKAKKVKTSYEKPKKKATAKTTPRPKNLKNKKPKRPSKGIIIARWTTLILILIGAIVLFLLSDVFNIKSITVVNNKKVSTEKIIELSKLQTDNNMFKTTKGQSVKSIKTNPYIESAKVKRKLNGEIVISVEERTPTYMLQLENKYAYINNQGYILEITETPLELPSITGFTTADTVAGNRLDVDDLNKLSDVLKIMETITTKGLANLVNQIDISDSSDYILIMSSSKKTVHFGKPININEKVLWLMTTLEHEINIEGEIFVQDVNNVYFREKV